MALILKDRVKVTSTSTGTGTFTLGSAVTGYQDFSVIGNGNTTYYAIVDGANNTWEVGIGTYSSTGPNLSRDTILESSSGGSAVDFGAGEKSVFVTYPAERAVWAGGSNNTVAIANGGTNSTATPTDGGVAYGDGDSYQFTSAGTAGQVLSSNGSSAPSWIDVSSPAKAGGAIIVNNTTASVSYTIDTGTNGLSVGPITVASGVTVTVASGQRWVVI